MSDELTLTPEQLAQYISASHDSCLLIAAFVSANVHNDDNNATVRRNVDHLRGCMVHPQIITSATDADKTAFADSVSLGESWLA
jgi:hypothetical protein